ncbi:HlyD family efflux transporter periplasmic adaptor subunit [Hyphomicrobium sp. xq]|uniref:HlyD family efflux transporter periplasmic adaptor subunit n=2 Tax=Hyphomicrobium album TaxID=2665159 RepID=A0A6I3KMV9_9HYPH|nr:HlyD family efflux transporter periplasmic adaptor subunit [Hyphomicrobium album]MTD95783.1 HlyD family efflux transporter periplasmic adaptor subunit [Hyphomicrobium album]
MPGRQPNDPSGSRPNVKPLLALGLAALLLVGGGYVAWRTLSTPSLPAGIAKANGRIEAERVDVATKLAGRLKQVLVKEGDSVTIGQTLALMDTAELEAQLNDAKATARQAERQLDQAIALLAQRKSELTLSEQELDRAEKLAAKGYTSKQVVEQRTSVKLTAVAAVNSAQAQIDVAKASIESATARVARIQTYLDDSVLTAPRSGRVQYRLALPGEVLAAGGKVLTLLDVTDVYMTVFLPTSEAGRLPIGAEARIIFDAAPQYVVPASVSFVATEAQFTPKYVETQSEREKLMFRVKVQLPPDVLEKYVAWVKTGVPGIAFIRLSPKVQWPENLAVALP